jgi:hypothetical protein
MPTLTALYRDMSAGRNAAQALEDAGVDPDTISLVEPATDEGGGLGAAAGAGLGAIAGGIAAGLGAVTLPGIGALAAAGWLGSSLAGVAGGALAGGAAGGLVGALIEAGIDGDEAERIAAGLGRGETVLSVRTDSGHRDSVEAILKAYGPVEISPRPPVGTVEAPDERRDEPPLPPIPVPPPFR